LAEPVGKAAPPFKSADIRYGLAVTLRSVIPVYRLGFALLTIAAIVTQLVSLAQAGTLDAVNYLTFFTIDSNLIATALFLIGAARWRSARSQTVDLLRGAAVVYMTITGAVFAVLLSGTNVDTAIPWVNSVVHEVTPMVIIADWLLDPPEARLTLKQGLLWLTFPILWITCELIRGAITGRYHYPFLNPANRGYGSVALYIVAIAVVVLIFSGVVLWLGNVRSPAGSAQVPRSAAGAHGLQSSRPGAETDPVGPE
jgi:hypothetical protein